MIEPPDFGFPTPEPSINLEMELEQRIRLIRNALEYRVDEKLEERNKRIEIAAGALETFCTGLLIGLKMGAK